MNIIRLLILTGVLCMATSLPAWGGHPYVEIGVGTVTEPSKPEVRLMSPLGRLAIGYETDDQWTIEYEHISSIPQQEQGPGLNTIWINKRLEFR